MKCVALLLRQVVQHHVSMLDLTAQLCNQIHNLGQSVRH